MQLELMTMFGKKVINGHLSVLQRRTRVVIIGGNVGY